MKIARLTHDSLVFVLRVQYHVQVLGGRDPETSVVRRRLFYVQYFGRILTVLCARMSPYPPHVLRVPEMFL